MIDVSRNVSNIKSTAESCTLAPSVVLSVGQLSKTVNRASRRVHVFVSQAKIVLSIESMEKYPKANRNYDDLMTMVI